MFRFLAGLLTGFTFVFGGGIVILYVGEMIEFMEDDPTQTKDLY